jgi:7-cyano-7-deazaguanine reductase
VRFTAPEFTSLCPITGQPDFAHFVIDYCPGAKLLESKSCKLYLMSFRNHASFHEECTLMIGKNIVRTIKPKFFRIAGFWYPRGGIPIDIFWQTGKLPKGVWLSDPGVSPYRGRGYTPCSCRPCDADSPRGDRSPFRLLAQKHKQSPGRKN